MTPPADRIARLEASLAEAGADAALVTHLPDVRYLSGFTGSAGVLWLPAGGEPVLVTDSRYEEQAEAEVEPRARVRIARDGWTAALADLVGEAGRAAAYEPEHLTVARLEELGEKLPSCEWRGVRGLVSALRAVKDAEEIACIERAVGVAESALGRTLGSVDWEDGPTEREVAARLAYELRAGGSEMLPFEVIVASGPRTALPHATPSDRRIGRGDLVLIDFGARVGGYCSDITRTFVRGPPTGEQRELHGRVLEAQRAALAAIAPGVPCSEVDAAAREALARHGWDERFGHGAGHGIGLEVHEKPSLSRRSEESLVAGNVVTVEPGVYLPARGGVRIEDDVRVGEDGARRLTSLPRDLIEL